MPSSISRRRFLQSAGAATGLALLNASCAPRRSITRAPNSRLQLAAVGVGGMMGFTTLSGIAADPMVDVVALCDVDENHLNQAAAKYPQARKYRDWRELLAKEERQIDAVSIAIPDHMHGPVGISAMNLGKHIYCQKPMTHDVYEARQMARLARRRGLVTQLGNQMSSGIGDRMAVELLRQGAIGKVKEVYMWSNRSGVEAYRLRGPRPANTDPVPPTLNWDLWLGTAPARPYLNRLYHPVLWRTWQDFGTGWQGDIGCHIGSAVFRALDLKAPTTVHATVEPQWAADPARCNELWPLWQEVAYEFPGTPLTAGKTLKATWLDGNHWPSADVHALFENHAWPEECAIFIGENGHLMLPHCSGPQLFPSEKFKTFPRPKLPHIDHYQSWAEACRAGDRSKPISNFDVSGPLTEMVLLGTVAARCPAQTLHWDSTWFRFTNSAAANKLLRRKYRTGWEVSGL